MSEADSAVQRVIAQARALLDDGDDSNSVDRAERLLQDVMFIGPEQGAIWQGLGDVRWLNGEFRMAMTHYERAHDLGVDNAALWGRMATSYAEFRQRGDALAAIDRALRLAPADTSVLDYFIQVVTKLKLWGDPRVREQSLRVANRAEELASQDLFTQARVITILVILRLDDASLSERALRELASFVATPAPANYRPWHLQRFVTYSGLLVLEGRYHEALAVVEHMMTLTQEDDAVSSRLMWERGLARRAILLAQLGASEEALRAIETYRRVIQSPDLIVGGARTYNILWRALYPALLLETGRVTEALEQIDRLLSDIETQRREYEDKRQVKPSNAAKAGDTEPATRQEYAYPLQVKARVLTKLGRYDEARGVEQAAAARTDTTTPLETLIPRVP